MFYYRAISMFGAAACLGITFTLSDLHARSALINSTIGTLTRKRKARSASDENDDIQSEEGDSEPARDWHILFSQQHHVGSRDGRPVKKLRPSVTEQHRYRRYADGTRFVSLPRGIRAPERIYVRRSREKPVEHVDWSSCGGEDRTSSNGSPSSLRSSAETIKAASTPLVMNKQSRDECSSSPAYSPESSRASFSTRSSLAQRIDDHLSLCSTVLMNVPLPAVFVDGETEEGEIHE